MRFYAAVLAVLLAIPAAAQFQDRVEVRLLEVEATVLDKQGRPVENLTRDDFLVTLDGKPAEITNFSLVAGGSVVASAPEDRTAATAAVPKQAIAVPTRVIIIFDDMHLHPAAKQHAIAGLREYIAQSMDASTTATIVTWARSLRTNVKPTSDRAALLRGLAEVARQQPHGMAVDAERRSFSRLCDLSTAACTAAAPHFAESQALDVERTMNALREVIESLGGMEGRKIVFFISEGMPMRPGVELFTRARRFPGDYLGALRATKKHEFLALATAAQDAGVVFNTIDPSIGLGADAMVDQYNIDAKQIRDNARRTGELLAQKTGGHLIKDQNDLHRALAELDRQMSTFYSLAVRAPERADEAKVQVRLRNHDDLRVFTATRRSLTTREESVASAVRAQLYERRESNPLEARLFIEKQQAQRCIAAAAATRAQSEDPAHARTRPPSGSARRPRSGVGRLLLLDPDHRTPRQRHRPDHPGPSRRRRQIRVVPRHHRSRDRNDELSATRCGLRAVASARGDPHLSS
jgi:VWFA-related protein